MLPRTQACYPISRLRASGAYQNHGLIRKYGLATGGESGIDLGTVEELAHQKIADSTPGAGYPLGFRYSPPKAKHQSEDIDYLPAGDSRQSWFESPDKDVACMLIDGS